MTVEQIVEEARHWPPEKVGELVGRLTEDLHVSEPEIEAAWQTEIARRIEEIQSGKVHGFPGRKCPLTSVRSLGGEAPRLSSAGRRGYAQATQHYAAIAADLGAHFYDEIERLIMNVRTEPDRFFRFCPPARRTPSRKFPYSVVYLDEPYRVWIVAVMHAKRRPGYWAERL